MSLRSTGLDITRGEDIDNARCALVVGRNSYDADPTEWIALKNLKQRGGQIVVIDPKPKSTSLTDNPAIAKSWPEGVVSPAGMVLTGASFTAVTDSKTEAAGELSIPSKM